MRAGDPRPSGPSGHLASAVMVPALYNGTQKALAMCRGRGQGLHKCRASTLGAVHKDGCMAMPS